MEKYSSRGKIRKFKISKRKKQLSRNRAAFQHALGLDNCNISFLDIAYAALSCDMLTDALLYVELHMKTTVQNNATANDICSIDDLYNIPKHIKVLHRVYTVLRDIDGNTNGIFHGLGLDDDEHLYGNNKVVAIGTSSYSTNKRQ